MSKQYKTHAHLSSPKKNLKKALVYEKKAPLRANKPTKTKNSPKAPKKSRLKKASPKKAAPKSLAATSKLPKKVNPLKQTTQAPKPGTAAFIKLQQLWYKKAAESGFQDIEAANPETGNAYKYLNTQSNSRLTADKIAEKQHYYRRWSNFLAHNPRFSGRQIDLDMAKLWADGATWAEIKKALKPKYPKGVSDWSINKFLKEMETRVKQWNRKHREGLDFEPELDLVGE